MRMIESAAASGSRRWRSATAWSARPWDKSSCSFSAAGGFIESILPEDFRFPSFSPIIDSECCILTCFERNMSTKGRPDPEQLLRQLQAEEQYYGRGRLKIF